METLTLGGRTFGLVESTPGAPLLLYLHGSTQTIADARAFTRRMFEDLGAHVIYPQGVDGVFNDLRLPNPGVDDVAFLRELIGWAAMRLEPPAIIGVGFSNGGHMLVRLLHEQPGLLDAVTLLGVTLPVGFAHPGAVPTPVQLIHGVEDPVAPIGGGAVGIGDIERGQAVSARETAEYFAAVNRCEPPLVDANRTRWDGPAPVELITVDGLGHLVPGGSAPRGLGLGRQTTGVRAADELRRFHATLLP